MSAARVLNSLAFAAAAMAVVMGLVPISTYETGQFGGSVDCGSAWFDNGDNLTGTGQAACAEGGLNVNRTLSYALVAAAVVLFLAAAAAPSPTPTAHRPQQSQQPPQADSPPDE